MQDSISVVIPAYNEEKNILTALQTVAAILPNRFSNFEIIVVNDASTDRTAELINDFVQDKNFIRVIHNPRNRGLGFNLQTGFRQARHCYITWFSGDNSVERESFIRILEAVGQAEMVIAYMANVQQRSFKRRTLSRLYTWLFNTLFGLRIRYYNGLSVFPAKVIQKIHIHSQGHDCLAEILVRCCKLNTPYVEVPFTHKVETEAGSRAVSIRNIFRLFQTFFILIKDIYILKNPAGN